MGDLRKPHLSTNLILFVILTVILAFGTPSIAGVIQLPQTGQTKCYDTAGAEIRCAGTGQDGDIRAGVPWPSPRFTITYCDATGPCANQSADCDGNASTDMVKDNLTGLVWARDGNLPNGTRTWQQALDFSNSLNLCGYSDWRLPNVNEWESLFHSGQSESATWLNTQGFFNAQNSSYMSSTSGSNYKYYVWTVNLLNGYVDFGGYRKDYNLYYVWPVSAETTSPAFLWETGQTICSNTEGTIIPCTGTGQDGEFNMGVAWPDPRFTVSGDCVTDNLTGLIWATNANLLNGTLTWQQVLDYVTSMNSGSGLCNHHDWRLPNRKELRSLVDYSRTNPALPLDHPFANVQFQYYWTSSSYTNGNNSVWHVFMGDGYVGNRNKTNSAYFWPVCGGQVGPLGNFIYLPVIMR